MGQALDRLTWQIMTLLDSWSGNRILQLRVGLRQRVKANRDAHAGLYEKAQIKFRERAIEELETMIKAAKTGDVRLHVGLTPPSDHTAEYDRAIDMLTMSQDDTLDVDGQTFAQLVRNEWAWFGQTTATNATYASGGKLGGSY